jgi:hypothetical protein
VGAKQNGGYGAPGTDLPLAQATTLSDRLASVGQSGMTVIGPDPGGSARDSVGKNARLAAEEDGPGSHARQSRSIEVTDPIPGQYAAAGQLRTARPGSSADAQSQGLACALVGDAHEVAEHAGEHEYAGWPGEAIEVQTEVAEFGQEGIPAEAARDAPAAGG